MLIEDWRPQLYCKGLAVDNISPDGNAFFIDEPGHTYYTKEDIEEGSLPILEDTKYRFRSPTGLLKNFYEEFDTVPQAKKYTKKNKLPITYKQLIYAWDQLGDIASEEGTLLHAYGESLWNKWDMPRPSVKKTPLLEAVYKKLSGRYRLAKTELLVYSNHLRIAGQVDLLLSSHDKSEYYILDYKFIKEPLSKKSFYNRFTRKYKMMYPPFNRLMDTAFYHYSIQMELYRYLMGRLGTKVKKKQLIVVTPEKAELVNGYPIRIWVDAEGYLQARYRDYRGTVYDSSVDYEYLNDPFIII